jgi:hypothetical protein
VEDGEQELGYGAGWAVFDRIDGAHYCIHPRYSPEIQTVKLKKNTSGTITAQVIAESDGGVAADARWQMTARSNGDFSPEQPRGGSTTIGYRVTDGGPGKDISVHYKITSTAGVVENSWSEQTEDDTTINHVKGNFSGTQTLATMLGPSLIRFTGSLAYDRFTGAAFGGADGQYVLGAGDYTLVASGIDGSGVTGCHQTGSKHFTIPRGQGSLRVSGTGPKLVAPYAYSFQSCRRSRR